MYNAHVPRPTESSHNLRLHTYSCLMLLNYYWNSASQVALHTFLITDITSWFIQSIASHYLVPQIQNKSIYLFYVKPNSQTIQSSIHISFPKYKSRSNITNSVSSFIPSISTEILYLRKVYSVFVYNSGCFAHRRIIMIRLQFTAFNHVFLSKQIEMGVDWRGVGECFFFLNKHVNSNKHYCPYFETGFLSRITHIAKRDHGLHKYVLIGFAFSLYGQMCEHLTIPLVCACRTYRSRVGSSFTALTAFNLLGRLSIKFCNMAVGICAHSATRLLVRSDTEALASGIPGHPKGVHWGSGHGFAQSTQVLPHQP